MSINQKDLPFDPEARSHLVNWEVLKRLSTSQSFDDPNAHRKLFVDDAPYDKYIEDSKKEPPAPAPLPAPLPKEPLPATYTAFTARTTPWLWACLGKAQPANGPKALQYALRLGTDSTSGSTSNSAHTQAKLGLNARHNRLSFSLLSPDLSLSSSAPTALTSTGGPTATLAYNITPDTTAALSFDLARNVPQATVCFSGDTVNKDAHLYAHYDHGTKATTVGGLVEFPGFDWRPYPVNQLDHGGRHRLWCEQELCAGKAKCTSKIGVSVDVNHALNWLAWCWADVLETSVLGWTQPIWGMLPGGLKVRELLLPGPHPQDWMRYHIRGLQVDAVHDFNSSHAVEEVSVSKRLANGHTLRGVYKSETDRVGLEWGQESGLVLGVTADRQGVSDFAQPLQLNCFVGLRGWA